MEHYKFGERVETKVLYGRYAGCWVPARVTQVNWKRGTVNVCLLNYRVYKLTKYQMHVPLCNIRRPQHQFKVNDQIFTKILRGRKQGAWIPAKIIRINDDGTYDLVVEKHRFYQVTKYAVHVPEQYLVPGDDSILRPSSSRSRSNISLSYREGKGSDCKKRWCNSYGLDEKISSEEKKNSSKPGSQRSTSSYEDDVIENHTLAPERAKSGDPADWFKVKDRQTFFLPRALSISIDAPQPTVEVHIQQPYRPHSQWYCPNSLPDMNIGIEKYSSRNLKPLTRASHKDVELSESMQKIEDKVECGSIGPPQRAYSDWEGAYDWAEDGPSLCSPSGNMTEWSDFSPQRSLNTSPSDASHSNMLKRPNIHCLPPFAEGKENSKFSSRSIPSYDFVDSYLPQCQAQSNRRDRIVTLGINKHSRKLTEMGMDTTLEDIATWLAEGKSKSGAENRKRMVKMMSFRELKVPIRSNMGASIDIRTGKNEKQYYRLSDLLGKSVDASKQGLAFFVGPINGELSYKIEVFNKDRLPKHNIVSKMNM